MDPKRKAYLRQLAARRRGVLLKDVDQVALAMALDRVKEHLWPEPIEDVRFLLHLYDQRLLHPLAYLKWAQPWQVEMIASSNTLPFWPVRLATPRGPRTVLAFELAYLEALLNCLVTAPTRYYKKLAYALSSYRCCPGYFSG